LDRDECVRLLAMATVGRVAVSMRALPVVVPVNFCLDGDAVVFRTAPGTKLNAACSHAVVGFQADCIDPVYHAGWSVLVRGMAEEITDPAEIEAARQLPLSPWAGGERDHFVRVPLDVISGRRLGESAHQAHLGHRPAE